MSDNSGINNEMIYSMLLNSIRKMNDDEMNDALSKAKVMLGEQDYAKLLQIIEKERGK